MHRPRDLLWAALLAFCAMASGCGGCGSCMATESHADVPTKLEDVKKLARPPDVVVEVERKADTAGGASCGHSPICLIVIPIALYAAIFPHKWDEATVREKGKLSYLARFETNGDFIDSTKWDASKVRGFGALPLKKLGKRLIVQVAEAPLMPDGGAGEMKRVPLLPQVDLIAEYEAKLGNERSALDRAELIVEAATWLGDESLPFLETHEKDPKEPDETRATVLEKLCEGGDKRADAVFAGAHEAPGSETILAGLRCANRAGRRSERSAFAVPAAELLCKSTQPSKDLEAMAAELPAGEPTLAPITERCGSLPVKTLLRRLSGAAVSGGELETAMRDPSPMVSLLARRLVVSKPEDRSALFAGIEAHPELEPLIAAVPLQSAVSPAELRTLGKAYAYAGRGDEFGRRSVLLRLFDKAYRSGVDTAGARTEVQAAVDREPGKNRALYRLGLMLLGDRQQAAAAALGLAPQSDRGQDIFGVAFSLAGCSPGEIREASFGAAKHKDSDRGALCTK